jgi:hypothetical protein
MQGRTDDDVIFMRRGSDLVPLAVALYDAERVLQDLLENHPQLLAGAQMNREAPPRFLLVSREAAVADRENASGRWSLDHLFLDQLAIPTLVEVKRSTDTRIRREVVGQMLDYAANGPRYWPIGFLQSAFEETALRGGQNPEEILTDVLGVDADPDEYWAQAERNLRDGHLRLVFVADVIPSELRAIIEFLNGRWTDTEVYGVEVRCYQGDGAEECFVPRLVGNVVRSEIAKGRGRNPRQWDEDRWFQELGQTVGEDAAKVAHHFLDWARQRFTVEWGTGSVYGSAILRFPGSEDYPVRIFSNGTCVTTWGWLENMVPEVRREGLKSRYLGAVREGLGIEPAPGRKQLEFPIAVLADPAQFDAFCHAVELLQQDLVHPE